jgi:hypothetical protein
MPPRLPADADSLLTQALVHHYIKPADVGFGGCPYRELRLLSLESDSHVSVPGCLLGCVFPGLAEQSSRVSTELCKNGVTCCTICCGYRVWGSEEAAWEFRAFCTLMGDNGEAANRP